MDHDITMPDVETASEDFARRFTGPVGRFFLEVQAEAVLDLLGARPGERLCLPLLTAGHEVWVHGSRPVCAARLATL